jgi:hypothetical protein
VHQRLSRAISGAKPATTLGRSLVKPRDVFSSYEVEASGGAVSQRSIRLEGISSTQLLAAWIYHSIWVEGGSAFSTTLLLSDEIELTLGQFMREQQIDFWSSTMLGRSFFQLMSLSSSVGCCWAQHRVAQRVKEAARHRRI